jgi:hypothetical protein
VQNLFYSTAFVNQVDSSADFDFRRRDIRWIEVSASAPEVGRISVGQGSMATDGVTNLDLSGTSVIGYSSVGDSASGQFLRFRDPDRPIEEGRRSARCSGASTAPGGCACATPRPTSPDSPRRRPTAASS